MPESYSTPPSGIKKSSEISSANGNLKWIEKELTRLEGAKVDKAYHKPEMKRIDEKLDELSRKIRELREEFDDDITGIQDVAADANAKAGTHDCVQKERIGAVEKSVDFWGTWFIRGLVGMIMLLIGGGGTLLYSHFQLTEATKQTAIAVQESKADVDSMRTEQEAQRKTLQRIETTSTKIDGEKMEKALRQALQSVLLSESNH